MKVVTEQPGTQLARLSYQLVHRAQCRGEYVKDLEIGAVDELLVGVSVVRDKDKG